MKGGGYQKIVSRQGRGSHSEQTVGQQWPVHLQSVLWKLGRLVIPAPSSAFLKWRFPRLKLRGDVLSCCLDLNLNWLLFKEVSCKKKSCYMSNSLLSNCLLTVQKNVSYFSTKQGTNNNISCAFNSIPKSHGSISLRSEWQYAADLVLSLLKSMAKLQNRGNIKSTWTSFELHLSPKLQLKLWDQQGAFIITAKWVSPCAGDVNVNKIK